MTFAILSGPQWLGFHESQEDAHAAANDVRSLNPGADVRVYQQIDPPVPQVSASQDPPAG